MTAGNPLTRNTLDADLGRLATTGLAWLGAGADFNAYITGVTDPDLAAAGYDADDIYLIRQFAHVLAALGKLAAGKDVATAMADFGGTLPLDMLQYVRPLTGGRVTI